MESSFYKLKRHRLVSGVLAGLADKFDISVALLRFLFILFIFSSAFWAVVIYFLLDAILPYKEEEEQVLYGNGPRRRKEAEPIYDQTDKPFS